MPAAPTDPFALPGRLVAVLALAGLAVLTLVPYGATRMYAQPWSMVLSASLGLPLLALGLRAFSSGAPLRLPSRAWSWLGFAGAGVTIASALLSPYRGPSLLVGAIGLAGIATYLLACDWLHADPDARRARLDRALALAALLVAGGSIGEWAWNARNTWSAEGLSASLVGARNGFPLGHANYTAGLMLLALPWAVRAAARGRGTERVLGAVAAGLALVALFLSGSRGGLVGLAVLGVAAAATAGWSRRKFAGLALLALIGAALLAGLNPRIRALLAPADPQAAPSESNVQRAAMLKGALLMGRARPLAGWGPGTTPRVYPQFRQFLDGGTENVLQLHSLPAQAWAETGAAGVGVLVAAAVLALGAWRRDPLAAATLAGYGAFALTDAQLDIPVFATAVAVLLARLARPAADPTSPVARAVVGSGVVAAFLAVILLGRHDPAPVLNGEALRLADDPAQRPAAVALLQQSLALDPHQEIAHFNLGWLLVVSDPAAAERHFATAARLVPDKGGVYFGLGLARLNQGRADAAAHAFALECLNDPRFIASPWWSVPEIAATRESTRREFAALATAATRSLPPHSWASARAGELATLAPRIGATLSGAGIVYRRERIGYPVLMRNSNLPAPRDQYEVREDPSFPETVNFPLPSKGWLPAPLLLKLLDAPALPPP